MRAMLLSLILAAGVAHALGSPMSTQGARVDAVANACGFPYRKLKSGTTGSSLASPIVGAAAWLKHLRDETSADQMRRQLVRASLMIEDFKGKVVGSGMFDPARLLANATCGAIPAMGNAAGRPRGAAALYALAHSL